MIDSTLCYIERDGAYLMLHRVKKEHDINRDKWIGIGGKFEQDESPLDCLLREVREETGLSLLRWRCRGIVTFVCAPYATEQMYLFTADRFEGEPGECDEGELCWVPKSEVETLPIWGGDRIFFRLLREERPFFLLKLVYEGDVLKAAVLDGESLSLPCID
ncbi:MAG: 8-oxo-dGTP diphosphatase [Clostridiaceae bacterium]|nr:8-oxo-dGTP diphosphatase [Clostridiaceae bacterium]